MTGDNDFTAEGNFPFMEMPKQKLKTSDYDKKCGTLIDSAWKVYEFFTWFSEKPKNGYDKLRSIIFLEGLFLEMLVLIKDIFLMRGRRLHDEHSDQFKDLLKGLNEKMPLSTKFIHMSNSTLEADLNSGASCVAAMRQDVVKGFRELAGWLRRETANEANREQARMLTDELKLNYHMDMFGCVGDNFEQHTNMVMNGLMLLAFPAIRGTNADAYRALFDNSIAELQKETTLWEQFFGEWKEEILMAYDERDIVENKNKMAFLKKFWYTLNKREKELLKKYEIGHNTAANDCYRATMGQRIYENLNGEATVRIPSADLRQYLLYVVQRTHLDSEIDKLRPQHGEKEKRPLFRSNVDVALLTSCFNEVYSRFCLEDDDQEFLQGKQREDEIALMAYLYIICKAEGYLETDDKVPFYKFCTEQVHFETDKSDRTFRNRLDKLEDAYRYYGLHASKRPDETVDGNYQKVLAIFHGTKKYGALRKRMNNHHDAY